MSSPEQDLLEYKPQETDRTSTLTAFRPERIRLFPYTPPQ